MPGPSWLGIGAQRSGTDWISRLLVQHPKVDFGTNGKKEQAMLQRVPDGLVTVDEYRALFPDDGVRRGDWSPNYFPSMLIPHVARRAVDSDVPLFVLLRDPVERFASNLRASVQRGNTPRPYAESTVFRASQFGQYASALESWTTAFPRDRFVILTYEEARADVQAACDLFWRAMGVESQPLDDPYARVKKPTEGEVTWEFPDGAREALARHYLPQVLWLRDHWGVDVGRWRNFEGLV